LNKRILITGANGFIGANLCNYLFENGYDISCLIRKNSDISLLSEKVKKKVIVCDYDNLNELKSILSLGHTVIHLAALTKAKFFDEFYEVNVRMTENLVKTINSTSSIKHLIFISSQAALGPSNGTSKLNEEYIGKPISWYGNSKYLAEQKVRNCEKNWTIIRPSSVYGEGDKDFLYYFRMIDKHIALIPGTGKKYISLIYVHDLIKVIERCMFLSRSHNKVFHATDERVYTIEEFIRAISDVMNKKIVMIGIPEKIIIITSKVFDYFSQSSKKQSVFNHQKANEMVQESWLLDNKETIKTLSIEPSNTLTLNLKKTYMWYKKHNLL